MGDRGEMQMKYLLLSHFCFRWESAQMYIAPKLSERRSLMASPLKQERQMLQFELVKAEDFSAPLLRVSVIRERAKKEVFAWLWNISYRMI